MGAIRMRVQTADKNITSNLTTPVNLLTSYEGEICMFVRNEFIIIKMFFTLNSWFLYPYPYYPYYAFSSEKVCLIWISRDICRSSSVYKQKQSKTEICQLILIWEQGMDFFNGGHIIMDYRLIFWQLIHFTVTHYSKKKKRNDQLVSYKHATFAFTRC